VTTPPVVSFRDPSRGWPGRYFTFFREIQSPPDRCVGVQPVSDLTEQIDLELGGTNW
jgi:hypothetical protein